MVYPTSKQPFEALTSIDERVDYIHNQLADAQLALNQLLEKEGLPPMAITTREVRLQATVPPANGTRIAQPSPLEGRITQILRHWPPGCNALVDLAVGRKDTWILPSATDTFVALDAATPIVNVSEPITKGEELWAIINNGDATNPHTITVTFIIEGAE